MDEVGVVVVVDQVVVAAEGDDDEHDPLCRRPHLRRLGRARMQIPLLLTCHGSRTTATRNVVLNFFAQARPSH